jgi:hypothetical protein
VDRRTIALRASSSRGADRRQRGELPPLPAVCPARLPARCPSVRGAHLTAKDAPARSKCEQMLLCAVHRPTVTNYRYSLTTRAPPTLSPGGSDGREIARSATGVTNALEGERRCSCTCSWDCCGQVVVAGPLAPHVRRRRVDLSSVWRPHARGSHHRGSRRHPEDSHPSRALGRRAAAPATRRLICSAGVESRPRMSRFPALMFGVRPPTRIWRSPTPGRPPDHRP